MDLRNNIFNTSSQDFEKIALQLFYFQYANNTIYKKYVDYLNVIPMQVSSVEQIPFLPISFFKTQKVLSSSQSIEHWFESSGTTGSINSKHFLIDTKIYEESVLKGFELAFGKPKNYCFVALLPNYLERQYSSLIYMVDCLMQQSQHAANGYYLYNHEELYKKLLRLEAKGQKTLLFGVSFALLDFAEKYQLSLKSTQIIETGGMKGRRKEITREALHQTLCEAFSTSQIHSEYGMTELFSQAYSQGEGVYRCPPWMRVLTREVNDPFSYVSRGVTGGINVIDFANLYSCSFIETQDLGKIYPDGTFSVLGRFDASDVRGCNLMVE